ncbi:MAG: oxygenase MpaB family protein [Janthinobacterium lividum]
MDYFVKPDSIVRRIWSKADTVLFIFAGSAAEFALNKAVDWLYFTGKLPADPLGRLFSTVEYARRIVFAERAAAEQAIDTIVSIHAAVEAKRGMRIPDWAYRDVLFMLTAYSISVFEAIERPLTAAEKEEIVDVFYRMGRRMGIPEVPATYAEWQLARQAHLDKDLVVSDYTTDLYRQYRRHLGAFRYGLVLQAQRFVVPPRVRALLKLSRWSWLPLALPLYRPTQHLALGRWARTSLMPASYRAQILALDRAPQLVNPQRLQPQ